MYYTVTISYRNRNQTDTFSIDKNELIKFIEFITKNIANLETFSEPRDLLRSLLPYLIRS